MANLSSLVVRVPASTSNLGPGFDTLGLALNLFSDYTVRVIGDGESRLEGRAGGAGEKLKLKDCPFFPMLERIFELAGRPAPAVEVTLQGDVPLGMGLGWSGAARIAGALAANTLLGSPFSIEELHVHLIEAEGHPDNVTPSLFGGLTATVMTRQGPLTHVYQPSPVWRLAILIPSYTLATAKARRALPRQVPLADAIFNLSRVPFVLDALVAGDAVELSRVMEDRLHEPYRSELIKRHGKLARAAREAGAAAVFISGAGPALAALCKGEAEARRALKAMLEITEGAKFTASGLLLRPETQGARVAEVD
jgi:homoserine kinase